MPLGMLYTIAHCASLTDGVKRRAPGVPVFQVEDPPLVANERNMVEVQRGNDRVDLGFSACHRPVRLRAAVTPSASMACR